MAGRKGGSGDLESAFLDSLSFGLCGRIWV